MEGTGDSRMSPAVSCTLRLPVEAKDVDGKKGKKEKRNSVTQEISQLPDPSLVIWAFCPCAVGSTVIVDQ